MDSACIEEVINKLSESYPTQVVKVRDKCKRDR